jgi:UDP-N-acetyl-D-mannosaminuronate dehydrogenase
VLGDEVQRFGTIPSDLGSGDGINEIDAILIASDHAEFKEIDWDLLDRRMRHNVVVDGRNILDPEALRLRGYLYRAVGRP